MADRGWTGSWCLRPIARQRTSVCLHMAGEVSFFFERRRPPPNRSRLKPSKEAVFVELDIKAHWCWQEDHDRPKCALTGQVPKDTGTSSDGARVRLLLFECVRPAGSRGGPANQPVVSIRGFLPHGFPDDFPLDRESIRLSTTNAVSHNVDRLH